MPSHTVVTAVAHLSYLILEHFKTNRHGQHEAIDSRGLKEVDRSTYQPSIILHFSTYFAMFATFGLLLFTAP